MQTRRRFLVTSTASAAALLAGGCGGSDDDGAASSGGAGAAGAADLKGTIVFTTWGTAGEIASFKRSIRAFEAQNAGARVELREVPFEEVRQNIDAGLEAGQAPDVFRVTYQDIGFYRSANALLDLSEDLPASFGEAFIPGLWAAVLNDGRPVGVPLHTDVSALVYNRRMLERAGISSVPDSLGSAWTWDEFLDASRRIKEANPGKYAFGYNWQLAGSYRWLNWLYAAGGSMIDAKAERSTLRSPEGRRTLELFRTWSAEKLFPPSITPKGNYPDEVFPSGAIGLLFTGNFLLGDLEKNVRFPFGAMPLPRDKEAATDVGGNALVATQASEKPRLAAAFLEFMVSEEQMRRFCIAAGTLPTRTALSEQSLPYQVAPKLFGTFTEQATTLPADLVQATTLPKFTAINTVFTDELEKLVRSGQSVDETLANMSDGVQQNLS
jgi:ABC-type glycerol-3-phosphate transport system substrate-binding protein